MSERLKAFCRLVAVTTLLLAIVPAVTAAQQPPVGAPEGAAAWRSVPAAKTAGVADCG
jgi:hypothetical protein